MYTDAYARKMLHIPDTFTDKWNIHVWKNVLLSGLRNSENMNAIGVFDAFANQLRFDEILY